VGERYGGAVSVTKHRLSRWELFTVAPKIGREGHIVRQNREGMKGLSSSQFPLEVSDHGYV